MVCPCCGNVPCAQCYTIRKADEGCFENTGVFACGNLIGNDYTETCLCVGSQAFWNSLITSCNDYAVELNGEFTGCRCIKVTNTCTKFSVTETTNDGQCVCFRQRRRQYNRDYIYVWSKADCSWNKEWESAKYLADDGTSGFNAEQCDEPSAPECDPPVCAASYPFENDGDCECDNPFP
jgi:hypothetical protein